jgi:hypothetical protein
MVAKTVRILVSRNATASQVQLSDNNLSGKKLDIDGGVNPQNSFRRDTYPSFEQSGRTNIAGDAHVS